MATCTSDWTDLVARVKANDQYGIADLYQQIFARKNTRTYVIRKLDEQSADDILHDAFLATVKAIQGGGLRVANNLPGFAMAIIRKHVANGLESRIRQRNKQASIAQSAFREIPDDRLGPEKQLLRKEKRRLATVALTKLSRTQREILTRFHIREESVSDIAREMNMKEINVQIAKCRATANFGYQARKLFDGGGRFSRLRAEVQRLAA
jgi:RNA polymerase sigma factor (sigma-70 family)